MGDDEDGEDEKTVLLFNEKKLVVTEGRLWVTVVSLD